MNPVDVGTTARTALETERLPLDLAFEALANERRRTLIVELFDATNEIPVEELVAKLAGPEADEREIAVSLYHVHLPKLDDMGVIDWDDDRGCVETTPLLADIERLLGAAVDSEFATN